MRRYALLLVEFILIVALVVGLKSYKVMSKNIESKNKNENILAEEKKREEERERLSDLENLFSINDEFSNCNIKKDNNIWVSDVSIVGSSKECLDKLNDLNIRGFKIKNYKAEFKDDILNINLTISN